MRTFWYVGLLLLTGIVLVACQSGDLTVGQSVINPQVLTILPIDTVTIKASTVLKVDSFATSIDTDILVGRWTDAQTGRLSARAFGTLDYTANGLAGQTNLRQDSLVMEMNYSFVYGDTTTLFDMSVHRLSSTLQAQVYYSTNTAAYETTPLAKMTVLPRPQSRGRQIRYRMTNTMGQDFFTQLSNSQITDYNSLARYMPGFAFVNNSTNNTLAGFSATTSGLRLYYHTVEDPETSQSVLFPINSLHFTQLQNDRSGTALSALKTRSDMVSSQLTDNMTFVAPAAFLQTRIELPYLGQFATPDRYADLNKALLVISPIRRNLLDNASPPTPLQLYQTNNVNAAITSIPDGTTGANNPGLSAAAYYSYDPSAPIFTDTYTFDLTYYIGEIIKRKIPNAPLLLTFDTSNIQRGLLMRSIAQRVALGGPYRTGEPMQLRLFITSGV